MENESIKSNSNPDRRTFLSRLAIGALSSAGMLSLFSALHIPIPGVLRETSRFKVGFAQQFPVNAFTFLPERKLYIFRDRVGIKALSGICTHLGCTVNKSTEGFICPCHGSRYDLEGAVFHGPAQRNLEWYKVEQSSEGQLLVDTNKKVNADEIFVI
jgi:cytochrome b6-f complex iron-sulfur subunit